jgi:hypothetical protein
MMGDCDRQYIANTPLEESSISDTCSNQKLAAIITLPANPSLKSRNLHYIGQINNRRSQCSPTN